MSLQSRDKLGIRPQTSGSHWSSDTTILGYVTPERMRWNLEQSQSTLMWQLQHGPRPGSRESLPADLLAQGETKLRNRGPMSPMTVQQNERLETMNALLSPKIPLTAPTSPGSRPGFRPNERDYKRLMDRLEKLASCRAGGSMREQLKEGKNYDYTLEEGERQICFANVKKKTIPLRVNIKKIRGKVVAYSSKTMPEPSETMCDEVHRGDSITISEPGLKFKVANVSFCFKAIEDAAISVSIAFGREKVEDEVLLQRRLQKSPTSNSNLDELRLDEVLRLELVEKVGAIIQHRKSKSTQLLQNKDFLVINRRILPPHSPERQSMLASRAQNHSQRISTAQGRKREYNEQKRQRTLLVINRHRLRLEEEARQRKLREQREKKEHCEASWLALVTFAIAGQRLLAELKEKKAVLHEQARRNQAAALIQAMFKVRYQRVSGHALMLSRSLCAFKLFHAHLGPLLRQAGVKSLLQHLRASARNNHVQDAFASFYRRVTLIQRLWRFYQQKEKERWKSLIDLWGKTVEGLLSETNKKWPGKKGARKRQEAMDRYLGVPVSQRNTTLRGYFKTYKLQYREKVRAYIQTEYKARAFKSAKAFQYMLSVKRRESIDELILAPAYHYLPSEERMRELIEQTVSRNVL